MNNSAEYLCSQTGPSSVRVSFVLLTMNRADQLRIALETARSIVTPEDELILVDGGSTDHTLEVASEFGDLINKTISEPDKSAGHAFAKGMLLAKGRYIRELMDDDELKVDAFNQVIEIMDANPDVDVVVCGGTKYSGDHSWDVWLPPGTNYGSSVEDIFNYEGSGVGFVIRRESLPIIGLHPIGLASDNEFLLNAISNGGTVKFCRLNLYRHEINDQNIHAKNRNEFQKHQRELARRYCSTRFYYRYRVRMLLNQIKGYRAMSRAMRRRYHRVLRLMRNPRIIFPGNRVRSSSRDSMWDGGFS